MPGKGSYNGEFVSGLKDGEFIFIDYNGDKYNYQYDNDKLVNTRKEVQ